ncbi:MAG: DUF1028 domain-containing protein [Verrucomicrobiota bacterium]|nr:DUF1028 domain-containing protein [Verrucomicrobiota bacterium]MDP6753277.1 DUF1028 domain-containing protein [Verrucomicrobiota bacterium]MDP7013131.1 DUF1028 domain-containing protein [Verrucomicrobiota bacterium]
MNAINQRTFLKRTGQGLAGLAIAPAALAKRLGHAKPRTAAPPVATFSIVAFDAKTGDLGVTVQSKFFAVGSVVPWAKAGVGAIATQSYANVAYGPEGLERLAKGQSARDTVDALTKADANRRLRQLGIVDAKGQSASYTGSGCKHWAGHIEKPNFCAQGNILTGKEVVDAMAASFEASQKRAEGGLCDWLANALTAGQKAGGDSRGRQSAALLVVRKNGGYAGGSDRFIDLRVDDHKTPIVELHRLLSIHKKIFRRAHVNPPKA